MKNYLLLMMACFSLMACDKETPQGDKKIEKEIEVPQPKPTPQPTPSQEVEKEDMVAYFKFDFSKDINVSLKALKTGTETIGEKKIEVTQSVLVTKDERAGSFTLRIKGKIGTTDFEKEFSFDGFAKKPADYQMANRALVEWKQGVDYYTQLDFDSFYRLKETNALTAEKLASLVSFYSSEVDGTYMYPFTEEDIKHMVLSDFTYAQNTLSFVITYNKVRSKERVSLSFDKNEYYQRKVTINDQEVKKIYMRGVYENPALFNGRIISYDATRYAVIVNESAKNKSDHSNTLTLRFTLRANDGSENNLAEFEKTFIDFKPLKDLTKDLTPQSTASLVEYMQKRIKADKYGDVRFFVSSIETWISMVRFSYQSRQELVWSKNQHSKNVLSGMTVGVTDLYLDDVRFELKSANASKKENGKHLELVFQLISANEVGLADEGIIFKLTMHIPSN